MNLIKLNPNCHVLRFFNGKLILFSYETPVAAFVPDDGFYRTGAKHSPTTTKHINTWLADIAPSKEVKTMPQAWFDTL